MNVLRNKSHSYGSKEDYWMNSNNLPITYRKYRIFLINLV